MRKLFISVFDNEFSKCIVSNVLPAGFNVDDPAERAAVELKAVRRAKELDGGEDFHTVISEGGPCRTFEAQREWQKRGGADTQRYLLVNE